MPGYIYNTKTGDDVAKIRWKRTDINLVALKNVPVDLFAVEIDQGPVLGEVNGVVVEGNGRDVDGGNGRGVDDVTDNALVQNPPLLGDQVLELSYILDLPVRLLHQVLVVPARTSRLGFLALEDRTESLNLPVPCPDRETLAVDSARHMIDGIGVGTGTKNDDLLTRLAIVLAQYGPVMVYGRWEGDMVGGEKEDAVALAALSEVDGTRALEVRCLERSDLDAKRGSEGATKLKDTVDKGVEGEKLWANRLGDNRFAESNLDVGESLSSQNILAALGYLLGCLEGESPRHHPYPEMEHTDLLFSCLSKTDGVNRRPLDVARVEVITDELANREPASLHRMFADRAGLSSNALRLGTRAHRPGIAGFEDAARVAGQAEEVGESTRVGVGEHQ